MTYLLDTDTLVYDLRGRSDVSQKLLSFTLSELCTSSMCIGELYYGAAKSQKNLERKAEVDELRKRLTTIVLSDYEMEAFGIIKATLEQEGERLADADLIIAATALSHNLTLVTGNLKLENWIRH